MTVKLPSNLADMVDFVAGVKMNVKHDNSTTADNTVKFALKHELTRVGLSAKVSESVYGGESDTKNQTKVVITGVQFDANQKLYTEGTYTFSTTEGQAGTWSGTTASAAISLGDLLNASAVSFGKYSATSGIALEGTTAVSLMKSSDSYLFLIPVEDLKASDNMTLTVSYDIVTLDGALSAGYSVSHATKTVTLPDGGLAQGKAYSYTLVINVDGVELSVDSVEDWGTGDTKDVPVDYTNEK